VSSTSVTASSIRATQATQWTGKARTQPYLSNIGATSINITGGAKVDEYYSDQHQGNNEQHQ
jgi:hypothetical protein